MIKGLNGSAFAAALSLAALLSAAPARADDVASCEDRNVILNQVMAMRSYANGSVKLFAIDQEEPAAAPAGIAVAIDRGEDLATAESFCRYVGGLSSVDLDKARAQYNQAKGQLTIRIAVRQHDPDTDGFNDKTLVLTIDKAARQEEALVRARVQ